MKLLLVLAAPLLTACPDTAAAPRDVLDSQDSEALEASEASEAETPDPAAEFATVVGRYDLLTTIAGLGARSDAVAEWLPAYEGGLATLAVLSRPHTALADDAGIVYIADKDAHAVRAVAADGTITTLAGTGSVGDDGDLPAPAATRRLDDPNGLWVRGDGVVYILDLGNGKIRRVSSSADGRVMTTLILVPGGISEGRGLWVADDESEAFIASGTRLLHWTPAAGVSVYASDFVQLGNLAVTKAGGVVTDLVVTDLMDHRVLRIDPSGHKTIIAGNGTTKATGGTDDLQMDALEAGLDEVRAVWRLDTGGYLLGMQGGSQIWYLDTGGVVRLFVDGGPHEVHAGDGEFFRSPGKKVSEVRAVTLAPNGDILVTENDFGYVRKIRRRTDVP